MAVESSFSMLDFLLLYVASFIFYWISRADFKAHLHFVEVSLYFDIWEDYFTGEMPSYTSMKLQWP